MSFSTVIPVPLGPRAYQVSIGLGDVAEASRRVLAAAGQVSGVAVLMDATVGQVSARAGALVAALQAAVGPGVQVRRRDLPAGESCKTLAEI